MIEIESLAYSLERIPGVDSVTFSFREPEHSKNVPYLTYKVYYSGHLSTDPDVIFTITIKCGKDSLYQSIRIFCNYRNEYYNSITKYLRKYVISWMKLSLKYREV